MVKKSVKSRMAAIAGAVGMILLLDFALYRLGVSAETLIIASSIPFAALIVTALGYYLWGRRGQKRESVGLASPHSTKDKTEK